MDPIVGIVVFFVTTVAVSEELKKNDAELAQANKRIEQLEADFFRLAGSHSGVSARDLVNHENQEAEINALQSQIKLLEYKIDKQLQKENKK